MRLKILIGSRNKIILFILPFLIIGLILNIMSPSLFSVGSMSIILQLVSVVILVSGIIIWIWSVVLIPAKVPKKKLIRLE